MSELPPKEDRKKIIAQNLGLVNQLRQRFFDELYEDNKDCYDEFDINTIRESNWQIWRFLRPEKYNLDNALNRLDHALKWRKELGVNNRTAQDVPKEFYQVGGIFPVRKFASLNLNLFASFYFHLFASFYFRLFASFYFHLFDSLFDIFSSTQGTRMEQL